MKCVGRTVAGWFLGLAVVLSATSAPWPANRVGEPDWNHLKSIWNTLTAEQQAAYTALAEERAKKLRAAAPTQNGPAKTPGNDCISADPEIGYLPFGDIDNTANYFDNVDLSAAGPCAGGGPQFTLTGFGQDAVYQIRVDQDCDLAVTLSPTEADLALYVITFCPSPAETCIGVNDGGGMGMVERVEFSALNTVTYYVVVDAYERQVGEYALLIEEIGDTGCRLVDEPEFVGGMFSTGVDNNNVVLPVGQPDPHYILVGPNEPASVRSVAGWPDAPDRAAWIGPTTPEGETDPAGTYDYTLVFDLTGLNPDETVVAGRWSSDDESVVLLNGRETENIYLGLDADGEMLDFKIDEGFVEGPNSLGFSVTHTVGDEGEEGVDATGLLVDVLRGYGQEVGAGSHVCDNRWSIRWFACDDGTTNDFDLERDGTPVCGSANCDDSPGSCWGDPVVERDYQGNGISWSTGANGDLHLAHEQDFQVHGETWLQAIGIRPLEVPVEADVGRLWLNDEEVAIVDGQATLQLKPRLNHLEWTSYNQQNGTTFALDYRFAEMVIWMNSSPDPACIDVDADEVLNVNDNCRETANPEQLNEDLDAFGLLCDCDDLEAATHPGAQEINDGLDNQCPDEPGYGIADETSGVTRVCSFIDGEMLLCWPYQLFATEYEVLRSTSRDMSEDCLSSTTTTNSWQDSTTPLAGQLYYYLNRGASPNLGSWGVDSAGTERDPACQ